MSSDALNPHPLSSACVDSSPQRVVVLGATGSIGTQTLQVIQAFPERLQVAGLSAGNNAALLVTQAQQFPNIPVALGSQQALNEFIECCPQSPVVGVGVHALCELATQPHVDVVVVGLVGAIGIEPTLAALKAGKKVLTANKETFVAAGHLVAPYLQQIVPIDSEHSAIFQCLAGADVASIQSLWLTASGGPFRTWTTAQMATVTPAQALKHPNWTMGAKISIDSATLMNKGLEVIEAHWLFGVPEEKIQVVVHPQSMVHSGVEFVDGSVLTQWGSADMRVPIQVGFSWPRRWASPFALHVSVTPTSQPQLDFQAPDVSRFPALRLAREALQQGGWATTVLNAANEVAVARFLAEEIGFLDIARCVEEALVATEYRPIAPDLEAVLALDAEARTVAKGWARSAMMA